MNNQSCKWCSYPLELAATHCDHMDCKNVRAQGFCSMGCKKDYQDEKVYILEKAATN